MCLVLYIPTAGDLPAISEFQVFNSRECVGPNLNIGKTMTASSYFGTGYEASNANDSNMSTRWNSAFGQKDNQWLEINFGTATTFDTTIIKEFTDGIGNRIQSYKIQYWDGSVWIDACAGKTIGSCKIDTFTPVTAAKVRLFIVSATIYQP